jgi:hypothetical protein
VALVVEARGLSLVRVFDVVRAQHRLADGKRRKNMAVPHYNYFPPAGQVIDATDSRVTWNGRAWMLNGRVYGVPSSHQLIGRPGSPMNGWTYDWRLHAWMEPSAPAQTRPSGPSSIGPRPIALHPVAAGPQAQSQPQPVKESTMEKPQNALDSLVKHPVAPVIGGLLVLAAHLTDEPAPPQIPADLPETTAKQWQMVFNQNQQRFQRRMELYETLGMMLLGYASTNAVLNALPSKKAG